MSPVKHLDVNSLRHLLSLKLHLENEHPNLVAPVWP